MSRIAGPVHLFENEGGNIDSDTIDATLGCVQDLTASVGGVDEQLMTVMMELETVKGQLVTVQEQLDLTIRLLNTPPGRREGFPGQ